MTTTNPSEPQNYREYRRLRAWEMHQQGYRQQAIADALGLTQGAVSQIIKEFGVQYHPDYIGPLLRQMGWSVQRPVVRATQRDEAAIAQWVETDLPALKKSPG
jgi:predicted transcriptional regulator